MTAGGYSELAELEHRLWAASKLVQDTRFRATCAVSGQLVAAQQRSLGTAPGTANPMKTFLGHELQGAPYPRTYPCNQACSSIDRNAEQMESRNRAKRPREPLVTFPDCENKNEQMYQCSSFPPLPEDLYSRDCWPNNFADNSGKHTRSIRHSSQMLAECEVDGHQSQPDVQHRAAIAAFRPEEIMSASPQQGRWYQGHFQPAPANVDPFPCEADVQCFAAALSARVEGSKSCQQADDAIALLPFPGMHTLNLTFPCAQPARWEAAQQLLERPQDFQAAMTQCPLSQVEVRHAVIAADGYTYDAAHIHQWRQQQPAALSLTSPLTRRPLPDRRLLENLCMQDLLQSVLAQRHTSL